MLESYGQAPGIETFNPYADVTEPTAAALYGGGCGPTVNYLCPEG